MKPEGQKINTQKFWKLKKMICPKNKDPPAPMLDKRGNLPWNMDNLEQALKDLDNNKSRDAIGHANKIFKCVGSDLKLANLKFMNHIKTHFQLKYTFCGHRALSI